MLHFELNNESKVRNVQLVDNTNQSARGGASIAIGDGNLVLERIVLNQFSAYLTKNNRLISHQSGNKKAHSTETLNILLTDKILEAMDKKQITALVLLDLSKAFDSIDHVPYKAAPQTLHLRSLTLYFQMVQELFNWSQAIRENWLRLLSHSTYNSRSSSRRNPITIVVLHLSQRFTHGTDVLQPRIVCG